jgi:hypothetical protein
MFLYFRHILTFTRVFRIVKKCFNCCMRLLTAPLSVEDNNLGPRTNGETENKEFIESSENLESTSKTSAPFLYKLQPLRFYCIHVPQNKYTFEGNPGCDVA